MLNDDQPVPTLGPDMVFHVLIFVVVVVVEFVVLRPR